MLSSCRWRRPAAPPWSEPPAGTLPSSATSSPSAPAAVELYRAHHGSAPVGARKDRPACPSWPGRRRKTQRTFPQGPASPSFGPRGLDHFAGVAPRSSAPRDPRVRRRAAPAMTVENSAVAETAENAVVALAAENQVLAQAMNPVTSAPGAHRSTTISRLRTTARRRRARAGSRSGTRARDLHVEDLLRRRRSIALVRVGSGATAIAGIAGQAGTMEMIQVSARAARLHAYWGQEGQSRLYARRRNRDSGDSTRPRRRGPSASPGPDGGGARPAATPEVHTKAPTREVQAPAVTPKVRARAPARDDGPTPGGWPPGSEQEGQPDYLSWPAWTRSTSDAGQHVLPRRARRAPEPTRTSAMGIAGIPIAAGTMVLPAGRGADRLRPLSRPSRPRVSSRGTNWAGQAGASGVTVRAEPKPLDL